MTSTNDLSFVPLGNGVYIKKPTEQEGLATTTEVPPPKYVKFFLFFSIHLSHSIATCHFQCHSHLWMEYGFRIMSVSGLH